MISLKGKFRGWIVNQPEGIIFDDAGNHYYLDEIRSIFYLREWQRSVQGTESEIKYLKEHLERKIDEVKQPVVTIDWGEIQEKFIHPHYRK